MNINRALFLLDMSSKKMLFSFGHLVCLYCFMFTCKQVYGQTNIMDYLANNLQVTYTVLDNINREPDSLQYSGRIDLMNRGDEEVNDNSWQIYFCSIRMLEMEFLRNRSNDGAELGDSRVKVYHLNGCLHKLQPMDDFNGFKTQETVELPFKASDWAVARTDIMPRWYVTMGGEEAHTIVSTASESLDFVTNFTTPEQWKRMEGDTCMYDPPTPESRYAQTVASDVGLAPKAVIPTPVFEKISNDHFMDITTGDWIVVYTSNDVLNESIYLAEKLGTVAVDEENKPSSRYIQVNIGDVNDGEVNNLEGYETRVLVNESIINITANTATGAFYGIQTILALSHNPSGIPESTIIDYPRFPYRGMHLDNSRNFADKEEVLKLIDAMAMYKLNKFHFHITDDEGWRLDIPDVEEATKVGSKRCFDLNEDQCILSQLGSGPYPTTSGTGFYTVQEYREILQYAEDRHIQVIPEFDMPGHSNAIIQAMEERYRKYNGSDQEKATEYFLSDPDDTSVYESAQIYINNAMNPCINSTYNFVRHLVQEVKKMHEGIQPLKIFNFGGDEVADGVWLQSPLCQEFTAERPNINLTREHLQTYFAMRVANIAHEEGLDVAAWEDGLGYHNEPFHRELIPNENAYVYAWNNVWERGNGDRAYNFANKDYKVILSHATHLYFDHPQEPHPEERGYYWATRYTDTYKTFGYYPDEVYNNIDVTLMGVPIDKEDFCAPVDICVPLNETKRGNIIGIQGHLWSETSRTPSQLNSMIYPRMVAMAERAWHKAAWEDTQDQANKNKDWDQFANTLGYRELSRLDHIGVMYYIPPPGARVQETDGTQIVEANSKFPGLPILYSTDEQRTWKTYEQAIEVPPNTQIYLQIRSADGSRQSRTVMVETDGVASVSIRMFATYTCAIVIVPILIRTLF